MALSLDTPVHQRFLCLTDVFKDGIVLDKVDIWILTDGVKLHRRQYRNIPEERDFIDTNVQTSF